MSVGVSVRRKEAPNKVTGRAKYNMDVIEPGVLRAFMVTSPHAHAQIVSIDTQDALAVFGVQAVVTGADTQILCGEVLEDRPPLARKKVRYFGEPVALVVATDERAAMEGASRVKVQYEPLPVVNSIDDALAPGAPLVHESLADYVKAQPPVLPQPGTNIADVARIRKGNMAAGWKASEVVVESTHVLPQIDHAAMETRSAKAEILHDGRIIIHSTTQAPFEVQKLLATYFGVEQGNVIVNAPLVGGAFGGKAAVQLEVLAYLASKAVGGRLVEIANTREQDLASSPVGMGLKGWIKLGASRDGRLTAAEMTFWVDGGAYTDSVPRIARAIASECTGPYRVDNVWCDTYSVYTNHTYVTAFRGFGHMPFTFCVERAMDKLAKKLGIDPLMLRQINAVRAGDETPTQVTLNRNNLGDLDACIDQMRDLIQWDEGQRVPTGPHTVRAKGISCFWKTSSSPPNAISGAIITFNQEGSMNLSTGTVEFGPGTKTTSAQILAERMGVDIDRVHVHTHINTKVDPEHWKTVASVSTFMVGRAVLDAAEDAIAQLKQVAAVVLRCSPDDLEVGGEKVYVRDDPSIFVAFTDIVHGYKYPDGDSIGGQIIGRGKYIMRHLTPLDEKTGKGRPGLSWTVGVQAVEVEVDTRQFTYQILKAATVMDAGKVINPKGAGGAVMGGMCQGLGYGSRECVIHDREGKLVTNQFRLYKLMRMGEQPEYLVQFVETAQADAPYGARAVGEQGVLGIPAALANALAAAFGVEIDNLPATPERIWRLKTREVALV